ncbi:hypothetical protein P775_08395 [Puniceibacterium antarcticum]|uniref:Uncharacterized protein n=1 Tax=Puniceibacterium antarcticum TaxID=1206336 RepID=A0A2G8RG78_9RHOB|nr:hypothetical protein [Puniceibacterium antarcticum]PIL20539.1 hypothetical protein P775_08395 [Puniceibacterium antarcticum]
MILDRLSMVLSRFGTTAHARAAAAEHAAIWRDAARKVPGLVPDLIRQGGLCAAEPVKMTGGAPSVAPLDPYRLAYEAGRRDLALQLLAAAGLTVTQMSELLEEQDYV